MPSYARKHQLSGSLIYHIYNRSHRGDFIFQKDKDFECFEDLLRSIQNDYDLKIYHWVIMSNHFHLCVEMDEPEEMSRMMAVLQRTYTHYFNGSRKVYGYLWQGRFKSQAIMKDDYLKACGRYIERNPIRAKIISKAEEYPHSSARYYCCGEEDGITYQNPFYEEFGRNRDEKLLNYKEYLKNSSDQEEDSFRNMISPLGAGKFKARLVKLGGHHMPKRRGRPRKELIHK